MCRLQRSSVAPLCPIPYTGSLGPVVPRTREQEAVGGQTAWISISMQLCCCSQSHRILRRTETVNREGEFTRELSDILPPIAAASHLRAVSFGSRTSPPFPTKKRGCDNPNNIRIIVHYPPQAGTIANHAFGAFGVGAGKPPSELVQSVSSRPPDPIRFFFVGRLI